MKKLFLLFAVSLVVVTAYAQDKVILKNGEELNVKVVKNDEKTIEFQYPGETLLNVKNKREISCIIYESGRKEEINQGIEVPVITEIKATSGWGGSLGSSLGYKGAIKKLKKKAAKLGAGVILIHGQPNQSASARGGGVQVIATAYK